MSIPTKPSALPTLDAPEYFITGRDGDDRYGKIAYGSLPGIDEAVERAEEAAAEAQAVASVARALETFGTITGTDLSVDMATWNAAMAWACANRGTIIAPPGKSSVIGSLQLRSFVKLQTHGHTFRVSGSVGFTQVKSRQLFGVVTDEMFIVPHTAGDETARVWDLSVVQNSILRWHSEGFDGGEDFYLETQTLTNWDHAVWPFSSSNTIYNEFNGFATPIRRGMTLKGHYGSVPGGGNNSPAPAGVVTKNIVNYWAWDFTEVLCDIDRCCDSDDFDLDGKAVAPGAVFIKLGDPAYLGNNYVNSHKIKLVAAVQSGLASATLVQVDSWTFGHRFDIEHDINFTVTSLTEVSLRAGLTNDDFDYRWIGKGADAETGNTGTVFRGENDLHQAGNGSAARPAYSFNRERNLGFFRDAAGRISVAFAGVRQFFMEAARMAFPNGSAAAPAITFQNEPGLDTGFFLSGSNLVGFSAGGSQRLEFGPTGIRVLGVVTAADDTAAAAAGVPIGGLYNTGTAAKFREV